jgi:simple sugar transport system ATP-binding protein
VSFDVRAGEIVGVAGVEGNGQTELIEALAGLLPASQVSERSRSMPRYPSTRRTAAPRGGHRARSRRPSPARPAPRIQPAENAILGVHYRAPA